MRKAGHTLPATGRHQPTVKVVYPGSGLWSFPGRKGIAVFVRARAQQEDDVVVPDDNAIAGFLIPERDLFDT